MSAAVESLAAASSRPLIAVFGATGEQGGAVIRWLLKGKEFRVRGITRNPQSESSQKLLADLKSNDNAIPVELVAGDLSDVQTLHTAFSGAWGAFVVTHFSDPSIGVKEEQVAKNAADQALKAGVKFFLYSALSDLSTPSAGRHPSIIFTGKNRAEQYIRTLPFSDGVAFPYAGLYASNFLTWMGPKKNSRDECYEFINLFRHDVTLPIVDIEEEYGATVAEIFRNPKKYAGQSIFTGNYATMAQWVEAFTEGTGKPCRYIQLPVQEWKTFPELVYDMFTSWNDVGYYAGAAIPPVANVKKTDLLAFWKKHAHKF